MSVLVNDPVKPAGVSPLNPYSNNDSDGVMQNPNAEINLFLFNANDCTHKTAVFAEVTYPEQIRCTQKGETAHTYAQTLKTKRLIQCRFIMGLGEFTKH